MTEWLRRQPAKLMGFARVGSNPTVVASFCPTKIVHAQHLLRFDWFLCCWSKTALFSEKWPPKTPGFFWGRFSTSHRFGGQECWYPKYHRSTAMPCVLGYGLAQCTLISTKFFITIRPKKPQAGFEPTTFRLLSECSTPKLLWQVKKDTAYWPSKPMQ